MKTLNFYYFEFSTYLLIIGFAFIVAFIIFYKLVNKRLSTIDALYLYVLNITGFAIGSKLLSLFSNKEILTLSNFLNSGYSYIGGILGSILLLFLYCKKYNLHFQHVWSIFSVLYPFIYSISKIGCFLNGCCGGMITIPALQHTVPLQFVDSAIMFLLFLALLMLWFKKESIVVHSFFLSFFSIRFFEDFVRQERNIMLFHLSLEQILCITLIGITLVVTIHQIWKKQPFIP